MQKFWLHGREAPKPNLGHPQYSQLQKQRMRLLEEEEILVKRQATTEAGALRGSKPMLSPPVKMDPPDLFHLLQARGKLLDWDWATQNETQFLQRFAESWEAKTFQQAARECVGWWSCDASVSAPVYVQCFVFLIVVS